MATFKHISSKNADYGAAEQYLTFEHDEFTMKPTLDGNGRLVLRDDYRISSLNCGDEDFAIACMRSNLKYGKNQKREDVKSHHYIISFDPRDAPDNGLTVDCQRKRREKQEAADRERKHRDTVEELKRRGFSNAAMRQWTFDNDNGKCPQMDKAHFYAAHWEEMKAENIGYLLWGKVGTGKSYFAGCIANALMEREISVCMTNFALILNDLAAIYKDRNEYIDRLCRFPLLILDDFGMERSTEYVDRFDALYEQGKMEHLMPTANQKHIVEDVPFTEWENPYIDTQNQAVDRAETELAFRLADRYISIQEATEGYDYTIYDMDYRELDGGVYDNSDITIRQALNEIVTDLKEPMHRSELEGNIHTYDELIPIDYDELTEKAEQEAKHGIENRIRKEAEERKTVADFKARTEELFHGINGQTQEDIELSVYAYLQSKIDEYEINIELVDVAVSGSRCRGLEEAASDLDVVVEYRGRESEDDLFNAFNEDGFTIGGVKVDINPITEGKTGTLGEYLPGVEAYLAEKRAALQEKTAEQAQEEKQTVVTLTVAECGEFHNLGEYHENIAGVEEAIAIFNRIPPDRMNGIPSIGINIHTEGTESYEDTQMDIVSGGVADLEFLDYVPDIAGNPQAMEVIVELLGKLPEVKIDGIINKALEEKIWEKRMPDLESAMRLAVELDLFAYHYDTYHHDAGFDSMEDSIPLVYDMLNDGQVGNLEEWLNEVIAEGALPEEEKQAKELLEKLAEYKPLAKVEELEECNYNMIDNVLNNEKPKEEKEKQSGRISIKEKLAEKKEVTRQRDKAEREVPEKETEKKSEREI
mgnify:FL=1